MESKSREYFNKNNTTIQRLNIEIDHCANRSDHRKNPSLGQWRWKGIMIFETIYITIAHDLRWHGSWPRENEEK